VLGEKNAITATSLLTVLDECFLPDDHGASLVLKGLLGDDQKILRKLFHDAILIPNFEHIMILSNDVWCVHLDHDDKNYAVFFTSSEHVRDSRTYWAKATDVCSKY
jgi:hypothetical protein